MKYSKKEGLELSLTDLYSIMVFAFVCFVFKMFM